MRAALPLALIALVIGGASAMLQGPLPGDVALARALQAALGSAPLWAFALTQSAVFPLVGMSLIAGAALGWKVAGMRGVLAVPLAYGLALLADKALRAVIFVPRPAEPLVAVAVPSASSGLPSTFGLVYGAVFGVALLAAASGARTAGPARLIAGGAMLVGAAARVVLGGHWPSQMLASCALGMVLALAALALAARLPRLTSG
jgi:membrane-associated phospholipid phosphatase